MTATEADFTEGYRDGRNPDAPEPSVNRSHAYRHSFEVGRAQPRRRRAGDQEGPASMKNECSYTRTERLVSVLIVGGVLLMVTAALFSWIGRAGAGILVLAAIIETKSAAKRDQRYDG